MHALTDNLTLAEQAFQAGHFRLAVKFAQYALARDTDDGNAWQVLGLSLLQCKDFIGGIDALENASLIQPVTLEVRVALAVAYGDVGRKQLSRDLLMEAALSKQLDDSQLLEVADGLESIGESRLALEACRRAGVLAPDNAEVHSKLGYYAACCGHSISVVEALLQRAVMLEPRNTDYRISLASFLIQLGRRREAAAAVDAIQPAQLSEVSCQCCLIRIANLFFDCGDTLRAQMWAEQCDVIRDGDPDRNAQSTVPRHDS